jgi:hypothetical protein
MEPSDAEGGRDGDDDLAAARLFACEKSDGGEALERGARERNVGDKVGRRHRLLLKKGAGTLALNAREGRLLYVTNSKIECTDFGGVAHHGFWKRRWCCAG